MKEIGADLRGVVKGGFGEEGLKRGETRGRLPELREEGSAFDEEVKVGGSEEDGAGKEGKGLAGVFGSEDLGVEAESGGAFVGFGEVVLEALEFAKGGGFGTRNFEAKGFKVQEEGRERFFLFEFFKEV